MIDEPMVKQVRFLLLSDGGQDICNLLLTLTVSVSFVCTDAGQASPSEDEAAGHAGPDLTVQGLDALSFFCSSRFFFSTMYRSRALSFTYQTTFQRVVPAETEHT
jgi:hypothetical protein